MKSLKNKKKILICDDDAIFHLGIKKILKNKFYFSSAKDGDEAIHLIKTKKFDIILLDIFLRTEKEGLNLIPKIIEIDPEISIIVNSSFTDFKTVKTALKRGALDYISKDTSSEELLLILDQALEHKNLVQLKNQQNYELQNQQNRNLLIGKSLCMKKLKALVEKVSHSNTNVLITGETGTGKELLARLLRKPKDLLFHSVSSANEFFPFVTVDSSTIQSSMAESILFGHEKGAFTGADQVTKGLFEEAQGGILFFDEIANMPLDIQSKLLRVVQEKEIKRLGSNKIIPLQLRIVCATNQNLEELCKKGLFKYDLLQRLNTIPIFVPPLRERMEDIPLLVEYFINSQPHHKQNIRFSRDALKALSEYSWPGNVRELSNAIAYVATVCDEDEICFSDLPVQLRENFLNKNRSAQTSRKEDYSFYEKVKIFESELIATELKKSKGNISQLSLRLRMDRSHLYKKLKDYGIHPNQ